jgi:UDP-N-acetyl-D-galactosamine dehydrogenase
MGLTFKENCPDLRNSRVVDLIKEFEGLRCNIDVFDPWVDKKEAQTECNILPINNPISGKYDAIVLTVAHDEFKQLTVQQIKELGKSNHVLYDVKCLLQENDVDGRL